MKFVTLPKATFYMGWDGTKGSAKKTEIKEDFEIAIHPVTQGQWQEVMGKNPSWFSRGGGGKDKVKDIKDEDLKHFPVESVSWNDAQEFIKKLNEKEKGRATCTACRVRRSGNTLVEEEPRQRKSVRTISTSPNRPTTCRRTRRTSTAISHSARQTRGRIWDARPK